MNTKLLKPHYTNCKEEPWFDSLKHDVSSMVKLRDKKIKAQMHLKAATLLISYESDNRM